MYISKLIGTMLKTGRKFFKSTVSKADDLTSVFSKFKHSAKTPISSVTQFDELPKGFQPIIDNIFEDPTPSIIKIDARSALKRAKANKAASVSNIEEGAANGAEEAFNGIFESFIKAKEEKTTMRKFSMLDAAKAAKARGENVDWSKFS